MFYLGAIFGGLFTFIGFPAALFLAISRFLDADETEAPGLFLLTLPLGPISTAWTLYVSFWALPHQSTWVYFVTIGGIAALLVAWGRTRVPHLGSVLRAAGGIAGRIAGRPRTMNHFVASLAIFLWLIAFLQCLFYPLFSNDPFDYAITAKIVDREKSLEMYPLTEADPVTGVVLNSAHPPGNILLITWTYMLQGKSEFAGLSRWIQGIHVLWTMFMVWYLMRGFPPLAGSMANLVLISTPLYFTQMTEHGIEAIRIATFTASFVWLAELLGKPATIRRFAVLGVVIGCSMFSHSIGFFTAPFFVAAYGLLSKTPIWCRAGYAMVTGTAALVVGGWQYISNYRSFGSPFVTNSSLARLEDKLGIDLYERVTRRLIHSSDILLNGVLRPFVRIEFFGLSFFLAALAIAIYHRSIWNDDRGRLAVLVAVMNYGLILTAAAFGSIGVVGNSRYLLTAQPFLAAMAGILLWKIYETYAKA